MISRVKIHNYRCFKSLDISFQEGLNILVGGNEAGKSTLLEAITLATTGRVRGRWAQDEMHPYWFNREIVKDFFARYKLDPTVDPPRILIELYFESATPELILALKGSNNSEKQNTLGLKLEVKLDPTYQEEFVDYMREEDGLGLLPTDFFLVNWTSFRSPDRLSRKPHGLSLAQVDSRTLANSHTVDYYTRQLLLEHIAPVDRAKLATKLRRARSELGSEHLVGINRALRESNQAPHELGVHLDQTASSSWEASVAPQVDEVPLALAGQAQQAFAKIELAMLKKQSGDGVVLVEEPENHLSQTRLRQLIDRLEDLAGGRQLIVTTHSTFVLNRLGLDNLRLIRGDSVEPFGSLGSGDVNFFKKLPNFDTLRLVLADKVALVEGPSDQLYLEHAIEKRTGKTASEYGIDIISIGGTSFKRWFGLASLLNRLVVGVRDNDEKPQSHWQDLYKKSMGTNAKLFVGDPNKGKTLEPQIITANFAKESELREALEVDQSVDLEQWMKKNKTEVAVALADPSLDLELPDYIDAAVEELCG